jgi:hypothetical protein
VCDCPGATSIIACEVDEELACVNTDADPNNCGECGTVCAEGSICCQGECRTPGFLQTDENHCGWCGHRCDRGFLMGCGGLFDSDTCQCNSGMCECPSGNPNCNACPANNPYCND